MLLIPAEEGISSAVTATGALTTPWFVMVSRTVWTALTNPRAASPLLRYRHHPARSILFLPVVATRTSFLALTIPASPGPGYVTEIMTVETEVMRGTVGALTVLPRHRHCHPDAEVLAHKQA